MRFRACFDLFLFFNKKVVAFFSNLLYIIRQMINYSTLATGKRSKMRASLYTVLFIIALSFGVIAQQGAPAASAKSDSAAVITQYASNQQRQTLNKQNGVYRPVKNTNWSKIKALFE